MNLDQIPLEKLIIVGNQHLYFYQMVRQEVVTRLVEDHMEQGTDLAMEAYAMTVDALLQAMRKT